MATSREARFKRIAQQAKRQNRQLREALEESERLRSEQGDPEELRAELEEWRSAGTQAVYRQTWEDAALKAGVDPDFLDDLWALDPPDMEDGEEPDPKAIARHVNESLDRRPKLRAEPRDDDDDDDDDQADDQGEDFRDNPRDVFDLGGKGKGKAIKKGDDDGQGEPTAKGRESPKGNKKAPQEGGKTLSVGEGAGRGGRDNHRVPSLAEQVDKEFAESGRTDPFKL